MRFTCSDCGRKQSMIIWSICVLVNEKDKDNNIIIYENEIKCKSCGSSHMKTDHVGVTVAALRKAINPSYDEIMTTRDTVMIENKAMPFSETRLYIERRIQEEPHNGELRLRHANHLRRLNEYNEAIREYEESLRLNENLIASLINLCDIFLYRDKEYKERGALKKARNYFERIVDLYHSVKAVFTTIEDKKTIPLWMEDREAGLYPKGKRQ